MKARIFFVILALALGSIPSIAHATKLDLVAGQSGTITTLPLNTSQSYETFGSLSANSVLTITYTLSTPFNAASFYPSARGSYTNGIQESLYYNTGTGTSLVSHTSKVAVPNFPSAPANASYAGTYYETKNKTTTYPSGGLVLATVAFTGPTTVIATFTNNSAYTATYDSIFAYFSKAGGIASISYSVVSTAAVPLPAALPLFGSALLGLLFKRRQQKSV